MLTDEQRQMVEQNLKLAARMAWKYVNRTPYDFDELYSIGCEAMVGAAKNFKPARGAKFTTYAYSAIHLGILHCLRDDKYLKNECRLEDFVHFGSPGVYMPPIEEIVTRRAAVAKTLRTFVGTEREKAAAITFVRNPYLWQEEIAEMVGVSQKTVSTAIRKLRKQLQMELAG